jgi:UDP-glucose 4-epimerase
MKILITGGAGFIGSHIQDALITSGHQIAIVDSLRSGKKSNINSKSKFYKIDIRSLNLIKVLEQFSPQAVFHLAAQSEVPYSIAHPVEDEDINIRGTMNLLDSCVKNKVKKVIYSDTGGAFYGDVLEKNLPIKEDQIITKPTSFYGVSKLCAEYYLKLYANLYGLDYVSLRYSNVYGPRQDGNKEAGVVAIFTQKLLNKQVCTINGDGLHTRDYVYVGDVVTANLAALNYYNNDYFNIATGIRMSNNQVYQTIEKLIKTGLKPIFGPPKPGDVRSSCLSPTKAKKLLKWSPKVSFEEGVKRTVNYYLRG